ncbi:aminotransferase class III-fold pyridoxal phosphate-dependent enzyme [Deltaproteobacteria bacterium TL4]
MSLNIQKCLQTQEHSKKRIPGMTQLLSKRPDMFAPGVWPGYYQKAKGVEVWDLDGNRYIDMSISGIGANILGYADPDVDGAVKQAIDNGSSCSLNSWEEVELADLMCELHPWAEMVRFARCGGEAMAIAVRIARAATGKDKVAFCGYHGWQDWYLAANLGSKNALGDHLIPGLNPAGVPKGLVNTAFPFRYNQLEELKQIVSANRGEMAAIVMEPIRNQQPLPGFWEGVQAIAKEIQVPLIIDEVSLGFRLNPGGAHLTFGISPDMAVFSKALGNGYPIATIIGKSRWMDAAQESFISSTMWTERVGSTAALACVKKYVANRVENHIGAIGEEVQQGWLRLGKKHGLEIEVGGVAPLGHFGIKAKDFLSIKAYFIQLMLEQGFLASNLFYAMYAHQHSHVEKYLNAVDSAFGEIALANKQGTLKQRMKGGPAGSGFQRLN